VIGERVRKKEQKKNEKSQKHKKSEAHVIMEKWNTRFQECLSNLNSNTGGLTLTSANEMMMNLNEDFVHVARTIGYFISLLIFFVKSEL
jgi:hypothetical protein